MNDEDFMNVVDDVFEEMDVYDSIEEMGGESDEDGPLSDDSDCISEDCSEDKLTKKQNSARYTSITQRVMIIMCTRRV